ncbi:related to nucleoside-diphosphate-sugar epimerase family protein [Armillaria ostoyae]|uniref:Related to nucleoside-diphosphate-sugar epimerase family protein n=1 Tax=Armillaria ostoyae TaxID=47428 RepID=A0A284S105_ARMOS|nr:related to nucleoside-diphosphate-sugar epimerase family protein [Armillaria ostoyae]
MTILLTGGTGKTATRMARVVPEPFRGVKFDWHDPLAFENVFTTDLNIDRIYLVAPGATSEVFPPMKPFIDLAVQKGVKRVVLLTASTMTDGYPLMGPKVHEYLLSLKVDYAVLCPSWFFENFLTVHLRTIKEKNTIIRASADGKIGFTSADDIADLAVSALTDEKSHNTDHIITGPELLSYDDVAAVFTEVLGRNITYTRITVEELKQRYTSFDLPEGFAGMLSSLESLNANGGEEEIFKAPKKVSGKRTLRSFMEANKANF